MVRFPLWSLTAFALPCPAIAQQAQPVHTHHDDEVIVVTGNRTGDALGGVTVLDKDSLVGELKPSLGETLASQPGVSATSFGPAASRPVLRGLSGDRVRILTDGIGSLDVSSSSADHAVAINPLTAERIEVLRGPAALQFGSSAIGGVVNVLDARIPRRMPDGSFDLSALGTYGTAADERSANLSLDIPLAKRWVVHADGNWSKSDDLRTGGYILTDALRREAAMSPDPELAELADLKGRLPNTDARSAELAAGLAYVHAGANVGLSATRHTAFYGVPIRYALEPGAEAEAPHLDVRQTRFDARAELPLSGPFSRLVARGGIGRYRHFERTPEGEVESTFRARGGEGRIDLVQTERGGWSGTSGIQGIEKKVSVVGEEKFLPPSRQRQLGLYTLQTLRRGDWRFEGGARIERSLLDAQPDADIGNPRLERAFTTLSASAGAAYEFSPGWRAGLNLSRSARAPATDELFANGPHAGTQAFEIGDPRLDAEVGLGAEASLKRVTGPLRLTLSAFITRFSNFIYQAPTGAFEDDLAVFVYRQGRATYRGFEGQVDAHLGAAGGVRWGFEAVADAVRATIDDYGPAPLIPPLRLMGALTGAKGAVDGRLEVEHAFAHRRTASLETTTPAYTLVNASMDWHPLTSRPELVLTLAANNLFDVVARRSTSLLKDYAPLAGRDFRLTARLDF